ncbi:MAG: molybdate transport system substrate-binding protein, partial [Frankiales bacterium]|nr:molybdate transport system substrate-binding protein [Frankiales bacterium]
MRLTVTLIAAIAGCALGLSGCGRSSGAKPPAAAPTASTVSGTVVVSAASSLKGTFSQLATQFEAAHPGVKVTLNFGGSDSLAAQITGGAPVDVFAAASTKTMATVTAAKDGLAAPLNFAKNELEIALPPGNPRHVAALADTVRPGVKLVLCAAAVPCGA